MKKFQMCLIYYLFENKRRINQIKIVERLKEKILHMSGREFSDIRENSAV